MAYVRVDDSRTWRGEEGMVLCPQVCKCASTDTPHFCFDFTDVLHDEVAITSATISGSGGSITLSDTSVDDRGRKVSFRASPSVAADFTIGCEATLSDGTSQTISLQGVLRTV
jgi:hypothetical protein